MEDKGQRITWTEDNRPLVPERPVIAYIEGDGTGPDIWAAARPVFEAAVKQAYTGKRQIVWHECLAGEKARQASQGGNSLPQATLDDIRSYSIALKGPLTTPVGSGIRSLNVSLRQELDLYACVRPVRYLQHVPSPMRWPEQVQLVIFRENTEDVYAGLEWPAGSPEAGQLISTIRRLQAVPSGSLFSESAIGIKPMSEHNSRRLVRRAVHYALDKGYSSLTLVHKGNIMKFTEGAFRDWGYRVAAEEFPEQTVREDEVDKKHQGRTPDGYLLVKDRIADSMFQQMLLRPEEYGIIATTNLNGDYLSDAAAAQVGGLGMAPGYNQGDRCVVFETTHGSAPKYAGLDKVNPGSLILSGVEMLDFLGWKEAARLIVKALVKTIGQGAVTYDLARQIPGSREVKCSEFGALIVENIEKE
ncbi:MAG: isocitrate dehydrogenase (NADP(+)) [Desulfohalobiaceae bacterium]|nr:isocitrate dehydrogenase (NADP(+)) [Desulfohalobiaceae bacterium]